MKLPTLLTPTGKSEIRKGREYIECQCACGNITWVLKNYYDSGRVKSCGCYLRSKEYSKMSQAKQIKRVLNGEFTKNTPSGVAGVHLEKRTGRWYATIRKNGKTVSLGTYSKLEGAIKARKSAEEELYLPVVEGR